MATFEFVRIWVETDPRNTLFFVGHISLSVAGALMCFLSLRSVLLLLLSIFAVLLISLDSFWYQILVPSSSLKLHEIIIEQIMR